MSSSSSSRGQAKFIDLDFEPYHPWNRGILKGIQAYASGRPDWQLILRRMLPLGKVKIAGAEAIADGVICSGDRLQAHADTAHCVCLTLSNVEGIPEVITDFEEVGRLAARHLIEAGYRHLACFEIAPDLSQFDHERDRGFREQAGKSGVELVRLPLAERDDEGRYAFRLDRTGSLGGALKSLPKPVGIFARNLSEAYVLHSFLKISGVNLPNEAGLIVGGNDAQLLDSLSPAVTGVSRNSYGVGYRAAEMLYSMMAGEAVEHRVVQPPGGVVERESTRLEVVRDAVVSRALMILADESRDIPTVEALSRELGVSARSLLRRFKRSLNRTPVRELQRARLQRGKRLLATSELSVSEIAERCGLAETASFSHLVKAGTGLTPVQYRNRSSQAKLH